MNSLKENTSMKYDMAHYNPGNVTEMMPRVVYTKKTFWNSIIDFLDNKNQIQDKIESRLLAALFWFILLPVGVVGGIFLLYICVCLGCGFHIPMWDKS